MRDELLTEIDQLLESKREEIDRAAPPDRRSKKVAKRQEKNAALQRAIDEWPNNDYRIFVGNLGDEITDDHLIVAFRKYPSFLKAKVVRQLKTGKSKGYGFVSIGSEGDYIRAMSEMNGKYVGKKPITLKKSSHMPQHY